MLGGQHPTFLTIPKTDVTHDHMLEEHDITNSENRL